MTEESERARAMWSAGDWPTLAKLVEGPGEATVRRAGVAPGMEVLDVGAGNGNVSIPAAKAGGKVTAIDPTPELFESGRARAAEAGVEIEWMEGEAAKLPFEDARFDAVLSNFGAMFASDHAKAASELTRVCNPGGVVVMTTWDIDGLLGRLFMVMGPYLIEDPSKLPPGFQPPFLWGDEDHVRECFAPTGREVTIERDAAPIEFGSKDDYVAFMERTMGPFANARDRLEAEGRLDELKTKIVDLISDYDEGEGETFRANQVYLAITVR